MQDSESVRMKKRMLMAMKGLLTGFERVMVVLIWMLGFS